MQENKKVLKTDSSSCMCQNQAFHSKWKLGPVLEENAESKENRIHSKIFYMVALDKIIQLRTHTLC